jgi:hypothetical protein
MQQLGQLGAQGGTVQGRNDAGIAECIEQLIRQRERPMGDLRHHSALLGGFVGKWMDVHRWQTTPLALWISGLDALAAEDQLAAIRQAQRWYVVWVGHERATARAAVAQE